MKEESAEEIMAPEVEVSILGGKRKVLVRELTWKESKRFFASLVPYQDQFLNLNSKGGVQIDQAKLAGVLMTAVGEELVAAATGLTREETDALPSADFFQLLCPVVALNLRPEGVVAVGNVVGRVQELIQKLTLEPPTTY